MAMHYHSQNLNTDRHDKPLGSKFWHGRAWLHAHREIYWEWGFGKHADSFGLYFTLGGGDSNDELLLHFGIPWLFSIFIGIDRVCRLKHPHKCGVQIHNCGFWLNVWTDEHEWSRSMPWWEKAFHWSFPWEYQHHLTEILEHKANLPGLAKTIWKEGRYGRSLHKVDTFEERKAMEASVSEDYEYTYTLRNGEIQQRKATVFVDRMTWRMKWWPLLPFSKVRTSISVRFNDEVGEGTGSWKGGTVGCGYEMLIGETPLECLRRMERERKFNR